MGLSLVRILYLTILGQGYVPYVVEDESNDPVGDEDHVPVCAKLALPGSVDTTGAQFSKSIDRLEDCLKEIDSGYDIYDYIDGLSGMSTND